MKQFKMSFQELKKKDKGKEIVTFEENSSSSLQQVDHFAQTEEVSMYFSEQGTAALLEAKKDTYRENQEIEQSKKDNAEKVGIPEKKNSSSKITPCIYYTSDDKARLRWSSDLHDCFIKAIEKLGGPDKATPKNVKEIMEIEGIALHHVKSHLQKFRLGKCNIRDAKDPYNKRYRTTRSIRKTYASSNPPRPQVNIRPKVTGAVKPKKEKVVPGSLYMLIEQDLHLKRCREAERRMQMALAIENQRNMLEAHYLKASMIPSIPSQQNSYISTRTAITQQSPPQKIEQWLTPSTTTIIPQPTNSVEGFRSNNMASLSMRDFTERTSNTCSMYEPQHVYTSPMHSTQGVLQINDKVAQGFITPYMTTEPQSVPGSSTTTTQQPLQLSNDCLIHDSYHNATFIPNMVPPTIDSLHQGTSNITVPFSKSPQSYIPDYMCNLYPPYNTLEVVQAQVDALQNSSTSRETTFHETNLSPSVTGDDVDMVDKYIDWGKVEEMDFELDQLKSSRL